MASQLEPSEAHLNFMLDKKNIDDPTIGEPNEREIVCNFCSTPLLAECQAIKVQMDVDLIQNTMREYDKLSTYWHVDSLTRFENIEVH